MTPMSLDPREYDAIDDLCTDDSGCWLDVLTVLAVALFVFLSFLAALHAHLSG